jgi:integrase
MRAIIGATLLKSPQAEPREKPFDIRDKRLPGFILRVQPSGVRSYYAQIGRGRRVALGKVGELTPEEARERCEKVLGNVAHDRHPMEGIAGGTESVTLGGFIAETYAPWFHAHRPRTAHKQLDRIELHFGKWRAKPLTSISVADIEGWSIKRANEGIEPSTVRRDLDVLSSVLTRAYKLGVVSENVARRVERPRLDRSAKVRYLAPDEEKRLRAELAARDAKMKAARRSHNAWLKERGQPLQPALPYFGDHLTPAVLLSMNTGMRRGELLALRWTSIDFKRAQLTIEGSTAKSKQTRHLPLNAEALDVLHKWQKQAPEGERVFAIDTGFKSAWAPLLVRAKITSFRWHDLRHHFASRLAQVGIPLNDIRELLGHSTIAMVLRYAHLSPDRRREAVARLIEVRT